jgi:hypothetical protein
VRTAPTSLTLVRKWTSNDVALKPSNIVQVTMSCIFATAFQFAAPTMANEVQQNWTIPSLWNIRNFELRLEPSSWYPACIILWPGSSRTVLTNWVNYHGGTGEAEPRGRQLISGYIVLSARRRCRCILHWCYIDWGHPRGFVYGDRVHEVETDWRIRTGFRLLGVFHGQPCSCRTWA